jgi:hypothetical protein
VTISQPGFPVNSSNSPARATAPVFSCRHPPLALLLHCQPTNEAGLSQNIGTGRRRGGFDAVPPVRFFLSGCDIDRVDAEPAIEQRWKDSDRPTTLTIQGDAIGLLRSLPEAGRMFMRLYDRQSVPHDGEFHLAGWPMVRDRVAAACQWPSTTNKSSRR